MYDKIQSALETSLSSILGLPFIQYENVNYDPTTNTPYIAVRFFPIDRRPSVIGWNGTSVVEKLYKGFYQISLYAPENQGIQYTNQITGLILDKFDSGTFHEKDGQRVVVSRSEKTKGLTNSPWYITDVNVYWYTHETL